MRQLLSELRGWRRSPAAYLRYSWALTAWLTLLRIRRGRAFLARHSGVVRRVNLITIGLAGGVLAATLGSATPRPDVLINYLVAAGAMTGGAIAIIFSISLFLLQGVADLYSSKHFAAYTNGWRDRVVYATLVGVAVAMFGCALWVAMAPALSRRASDTIIVLSLLLVGLVFALIDWQYEHVRQKINPANALLFLRARGLAFIDDLQLDAERIARVLTAQHAELKKEEALATAYNRPLRFALQEVGRQVETLIEVSLKLADRQELETAKLGFRAVHDVLARLLTARQTSSVAFPSTTVFFTMESDSAGLLTPSLERMNKAGEKFILERKDELAVYIIDVYGALAAVAKDITHLSPARDNPVLDRLVGYLHSYLSYGAAADNLEMMFQGARVLGQISAIAAEKGLATTLAGLQQHLLETANAGLEQSRMVVVDRCAEVFARSIVAIFRSDALARDHSISDSLKGIATITSRLHARNIAGMLPGGFAASFSLTKGYDELNGVLPVVDSLYRELTDDSEKQRLRSDMANYFESLNQSLRRLSEELRSCDSILMTSLAGLLFRTNSYMIALLKDEDFSEQHGDIRKWLSWNVHLPSWFAHHSIRFDASSHSFAVLADSVAKTGIVAAVECSDPKLVADAIGCLASMAGHALTKSTGGYGDSEARLMEKACQLGVFALKRGWADVIAALRARITDFEAKFFDKFLTKLPAGLPPGFDPRNHNVMGLPHHDQLLRELVSWKKDLQRYSGEGANPLLDDAESMLAELVDATDIDRFTMEIWAVRVEVRVTTL